MKKVFFVAILLLQYLCTFCQTANFTFKNVSPKRNDGSWITVNAIYSFEADSLTCECTHIWDVKLVGSSVCESIHQIDTVRGNCHYEAFFPHDCFFSQMIVTHTVCCPDSDCIESDPQEIDYPIKNPVIEVSKVAFVNKGVLRYDEKFECDIKLSLYNLNGQLLSEVETKANNSTEFPLPEILSGIYLLKIEGNNIYRIEKVYKQF